MNKTKRSSMMIRTVTLLAVAMMFTMCMVSGTFAKYTSTASGSDNASVAKWDIEVNNDKITTGTFTFPLFDTINDTKDHNDETDVADNKIAPGTEGSFGINIENLSEVNAEYSVVFSVTNTQNIPVQFSLNGEDWTDDITTLNKNGSIAMSGTDSVNVFWKWVFYVDGSHDTADKALGIAAAGATVPEITVTATVTATQVD